MTLTPLKNLDWESRFFSLFPGDEETRNFTRQVSGITHSRVTPTPVREPSLVGWSKNLGDELGILKPSDNESLSILSGNIVLPSMHPYAARYAGHQFGQWAGQLGDGRAITLGEVTTPAGRMEFQLKGAGPTPYSRRADGRAVLRSSVREFLCSEAMHFLGVPTTRALSVVTTGDDVIRDLFYDGNPEAEPGAIVCRVSPSFLRFGNFQILTASGEYDLLKKLTDFLIEDHYPEISLSHPDSYGLLLDEIARRTARLMTEWMRVGFVHGVMNTDNMSVLGLTIDYGPYGWLEPYDPQWTPNTTDESGRRYAFGNQPGIGQWNFARLCEALYPLVKDEKRLQESLRVYRDTFESGYAAMMASKLGIARISSDEERKFLEELFELMGESEADYTLFFRALSQTFRDAEESLERIISTFYLDLDQCGELCSRWKKWLNQYFSKIKNLEISELDRISRMKRVNPKFVLRNYLAQEAITAATAGDSSKIERLLKALEHPYDEQPSNEDLAVKRPEWARSAPGCGALSCSS